VNLAYVDLALLVAVIFFVTGTFNWLSSSVFRKPQLDPPFNFELHKHETLAYLGAFRAGDSNLFLSSHDEQYYPLSFMVREVEHNTEVGRKFSRDVARHLAKQAQFRGATVRSF